MIPAPRSSNHFEEESMPDRRVFSCEHVKMTVDGASSTTSSANLPKHSLYDLKVRISEMLYGFLALIEALSLQYSKTNRFFNGLIAENNSSHFPTSFMKCWTMSPQAALRILFLGNHTAKLSVFTNRVSLPILSCLVTSTRQNTSK